MTMLRLWAHDMRRTTRHLARAITSMAAFIAVLIAAPLSGAVVQAQVLLPAQRPHAVPDYAGYVVPAQCLSAAQRARFQMDDRSHMLRPDTLPFVAGRQPLPDGVLETARQCAARMDPARIALRDWRTLIQLYLLADQPERVQALIALQLDTLARSHAAVQERAAYLERIVEQLLPGEPGASKWPTLARTYVQQLDALGDIAAPQRQRAHHRLKWYAWATGHFDSAAAEAEQVIALAHRMAPAARDAGVARVTAQGYLTLLANALIAHRASPRQASAADASDVTQLVSRMRADLPLFAKDSIFMNARRIQALEQEVTGGYDVTAPPVDAAFWFNRPDTIARPAAGHVTLVSLVKGMEEAETRVMLAPVRRIMERHPGDRVEAVVVTATRGSFLYSANMLSPRQEADDVWRYLRDELRVPAILAVEQTRFQKRPDGVLIPQATATRTRYRQHGLLVSELCDRRGAPVAVQLWDYFKPSPQNERALEALVRAVARE
jgi:hypothetical protein